MEIEDIMEKAPFVIAGVFIIGLVLFSSVYYVGGGERGVMFRKAIGPVGYDLVELNEGFGFKMPILHSVTSLNVRTQSLGLYSKDNSERGEYTVLTPKDKNGVNFEQDITIRYRLDANQAAEFLKSKGKSTDDIVVTAIRSTAREILGTYSQENLPKIKGNLSEDIQIALQERIDAEAFGDLKPGFIIIEAVDLRDTNFNDEIEAAIIKKQGALQAAQQKEYDRMGAEETKKIAILVAEGEKQAAILKAQGEAEGILVVAEAKADGLRQINLASQGLSQAYVSMKYAEALGKNAENGNAMIVDIARFGGNNIGLMEWNEMMTTPIVKTAVEE